MYRCLGGPPRPTVFVFRQTSPAIRLGSLPDAAGCTARSHQDQVSREVWVGLQVRQAASGAPGSCMLPWGVTALLGLNQSRARSAITALSARVAVERSGNKKAMIEARKAAAASTASATEKLPVQSLMMPTIHGPRSPPSCPIVLMLKSVINASHVHRDANRAR